LNGWKVTQSIKKKKKFLLNELYYDDMKEQTRKMKRMKIERYIEEREREREREKKRKSKRKNEKKVYASKKERKIIVEVLMMNQQER